MVSRRMSRDNSFGGLAEVLNVFGQGNDDESLSLLERVELMAKEKEIWDREKADLEALVAHLQQSNRDKADLEKLVAHLQEANRTLMEEKQALMQENIALQTQLLARDEGTVTASAAGKSLDGDAVSVAAESSAGGSGKAKRGHARKRSSFERFDKLVSSLLGDLPPDEVDCSDNDDERAGAGKKAADQLTAPTQQEDYTDVNGDYEETYEDMATACRAVQESLHCDDGGGGAGDPQRPPVTHLVRGNSSDDGLSIVSELTSVTTRGRRGKRRGSFGQFVNKGLLALMGEEGDGSAPIADDEDDGDNEDSEGPMQRRQTMPTLPSARNVAAAAAAEEEETSFVDFPSRSQRRLGATASEEEKEEEESSFVDFPSGSQRQLRATARHDEEEESDHDDVDDDGGGPGGQGLLTSFRRRPSERSLDDLKMEVKEGDDPNGSWWDRNRHAAQASQTSCVSIPPPDRKFQQRRSSWFG